MKMDNIVEKNYERWINSDKLSKEEKVSLTDFINIVKESNKEVSKLFENIDKETKVKKSK